MWHHHLILGKAKKPQLCPKTKYLKTSMLSVAGKHLKTCSSLRNNRNYIAQLSIANPKDLRLFTWRKARVWNFRSDLTAPNHKSVRKTEHPVFQETLHMWEIKFSQARTSDFQACGGLSGYSGKLKKNSEHACLSQILIPMCSSPKSHKYLSLLSFDSLHCISSMSLKVWLSTAYISSLRESKNGFYTKKNKQKRFLILKIFGKGSNWAFIQVISKGVFVSFSSAHLSSQWTGRPLTNQETGSFWFFSLKRG